MRSNTTDMERRMAIRELRLDSDAIMRKQSKPVKEMTPRIAELVEDMIETMRDSDGVGLAAVQVGVLKRIFVVEVEENHPIVFINPQILEVDGEQVGYEGCLSVPGKTGIVRRPNHVKVKAFDKEMQEFELEGEALLARAILHENDHLNGILYTDMVEGELMDVEELEQRMARQSSDKEEDHV